MKVAALIPARAGSVRVVNKNVRLLGGLPLLARKVLQLRDASVGQVFVGSDSPDYIKLAEAYGAVGVLRDPTACDEAQASANEMIADFVIKIPQDFDVILWAHCTNPFLFAKQYDAALKLFKSRDDRFDSLLSVQKIQNHLWSQELKPINYDPWSPRHTLAKDLDPIFMQSGGIFIQRREEMCRNSYFFGANPQFIVHDEIEAFDINTEEEFRRAELLQAAVDEVAGFVGVKEHEQL